MKPHTGARGTCVMKRLENELSCKRSKEELLDIKTSPCNLLCLYHTLTRGMGQKVCHWEGACKGLSKRVI